jgi:hypothetical protein
MISGGFILHGKSKKLNAEVAFTIAIKLLGKQYKQYIVANSHPDFLLIKNEENCITIEQARRVIEFLSTTSEFGGYKVVIIEEAEHMNRNSANALLKILEEPPNKSIIILTTNKLFALLPTIRSRCQKVFVKGDYDRDYSKDDEFYKMCIGCLNVGKTDISILPEQKEIFNEIVFNHVYDKFITLVSPKYATKYLDFLEFYILAQDTHPDIQSFANSSLFIVQ